MKSMNEIILTIKEIRKKDQIFFEGVPLQVTEVVKGHSCRHLRIHCKKYYIEGIDIFTGEKHKFHFTDELVFERLVCNKSKWNVLSYDDEDYVTLMDEEGNTRQDLKFPNIFEEDKEITNKIKGAIEEEKEIDVGVIEIMKKEKIIAIDRMNMY